MTVSAKIYRDIDGFSKQKISNLAHTGTEHLEILPCHYEQEARLLAPICSHGSVLRGERSSYK